MQDMFHIMIEPNSELGLKKNYIDSSGIRKMKSGVTNNTAATHTNTSDNSDSNNNNNKNGIPKMGGLQFSLSTCADIKSQIKSDLKRSTSCVSGFQQNTKKKLSNDSMNSSTDKTDKEKEWRVRMAQNIKNRHPWGSIFYSHACNRLFISLPYQFCVSVCFLFLFLFFYF